MNFCVLGSVKEGFVSKLINRLLRQNCCQPNDMREQGNYNIYEKLQYFLFKNSLFMNDTIIYKTEMFNAVMFKQTM